MGLHGDSHSGLFDQINLVVSDMDAAIAFYRRLGLDIDAPPDWPPGSGAVHAEAAMPNGTRFELDNEVMARVWHAAWRGGDTPPGGGRVVVGFSLPSREAVNERYADLTEAGHTGLQPPYDAFWGARYAIVADPDGNHVGLMSPIDPDRRHVPEG